MSARFIVAGTDTDVGKTVVAAGLARALGAAYWKPVQAGLAGETDSEAVARLTAGRVPVLPEAFRLTTPCSPHEAASIDGVTITARALALPALAVPAHDGPLVIEGAGGLMVPLAPGLLAIDLFASWRLPVVLVARTSLGTINHTLLSLEALHAHGLMCAGVIFSGEANAANEDAIVDFGQCRRLGRLPRLDTLNAETLERAFADHIATDLLA